MIVQSILFDKTKWSIFSAEKWLDRHKYKHPKLDITDNFLRFRQVNPNPNNRYRNINIGNGIEFILMF